MLQEREPSFASQRSERVAPKVADALLSTGVRMRYATQGDAETPPILLLHGYTDSWRSFSATLDGLAENYRPFALSLRGHGESERPHDGYTIRHLADDVLAFMDALGLPRVAIVGHCMGSFVAQQAALLAPARVTHLVLEASGVSPRCIAGWEEFLQSVERLEDPVPEAFAREFQESTIYHPVSEAFLRQAVAESLRLPASIWKAALRGMLAPYDSTALAQIEAPTLILWGEHDELFSFADQEALMATLPNAMLKVYPETGHALHWERPGEFVRDVHTFLAQTGRK